MSDASFNLFPACEGGPAGKRRTRRSRFVLLAVCLCLLPGPGVPVRAAIVQAGEDQDADRKVEAAAHEAGARHPAAASVHMNDVGGALVRHGSGVYLGASSDGRKGLLLTSAHLFVEDMEATGPLPYTEVAVVFGADPQESKEPMRVTAQRVLLHPGFTRAHRGRPGGFGGRLSPHRDIKDDIALVEFALPACAETLAAAGITPALLDDAGLYRGVQAREAVFLGFGVFGNTREWLFPDNQRVHLAHTLVSQVDYYGCPVLLNLAPLDEEATGSHLRGAAEASLRTCFRAQPSPREVRLFATPERVLLQTHAEHALPAPGDSGGPLLLEAPDGTFRVAGLTSRTVRHKARLFRAGKWRWMWAMASIWEPVGKHLDWINQVRGGKPSARTPVLEPGKAGWCRSASAEEDSCSLCVIM